MILEERHCILCKTHTEKRVKYPANFDQVDLTSTAFSARRSPDRRHFRLMECTGCGLVFSDPACDASALEALYRDSRVSYTRLEQEIYASYAPLLDRALSHLARRGTFVEIGGGCGFMLRYGHEHAFRRLVEIEPSADAEARFDASLPGATFIRHVFTGAELPVNSASLICFFQMLDHVPAPLEFVERVAAALEPGGVAVCVTHDTHALSARVLGERSPIYDVEHTYLFNRSNLAALFTRAGLTPLETSSLANDYALRYWLHLLPLHAAIKRGVGGLFDATRLGDARLRLRAGNLAIIAKKDAATAR